MPIPDFQALMLPVLKAYAKSDDASLAAIRHAVARAVNLTDDDLQEVLPSGRQTVITNRVSWAVIHMERAGLLKRVRRGVYRVTDAGRGLLARDPSGITMRTLREYPAYVNWTTSTRAVGPDDPTVTRHSPEEPVTPEEALAHAAATLSRTLQADLLHKVRTAEPAVLERVVLALLSAMGYGGGDARMARVTGGPGDQGIDGTIQEDALGLDEVYVQVKRYADGNTVGAGDLRNFAGAIDAAGTAKGVFVTTSDFTAKARDYIEKSPKRIVLINGGELAALMVKHDIGVRVVDTHAVKRIDDDYLDGDLSG